MILQRFKDDRLFIWLLTLNAFKCVFHLNAQELETVIIDFSALHINLSLPLNRRNNALQCPY